MRKILLILLMSVLGIQFNSFAQSPTVQSIINQADIDSLVYFVEELSGEVQTVIGGTPYTIISRNKYETGNAMAAQYLEEKLQSYGLDVYTQSFGSIGINVYAIQTGTLYPDEFYMICAHYDDMPYGSTAPGADDNASGTSAVLEAARIFSQYSSEYSIIYALWDEEEQGLVGSDYYATQAASNGVNIKGVLNLDMVAWDSDSDNIMDLHTRSVANSIQLKDEALQVNADYNIGLTIDVKTPGSTSSDHASFWYNGFGAILIIEDGSDFNNYYHTVNDLVANFNLPYFLKNVQLAYGTLATLTVVTNSVPVELVNFTAEAVGNIVQLNWVTATETNNLGFEIQRSIGEFEFQTVAFIQGSGTSTEVQNYSYSDHVSQEFNSVIQYRLKQVDYNGTFDYSNIINVEVRGPEVFVLKQNYPNPFNPSTNIEFNIPKDEFVNLVVYDLMGEEVVVLESGFKKAGSHEYNFNASKLPSGVYFYTLNAGEYTSTMKMMLVK